MIQLHLHSRASSGCLVSYELVGPNCLLFVILFSLLGFTSINFALYCSPLSISIRQYTWAATRHKVDTLRGKAWCFYYPKEVTHHVGNGVFAWSYQWSRSTHYWPCCTFSRSVDVRPTTNKPTGVTWHLIGHLTPTIRATSAMTRKSSTMCARRFSLLQNRRKLEKIRSTTTKRRITQPRILHQSGLCPGCFKASW